MQITNPVPPFAKLSISLNMLQIVKKSVIFALELCVFVALCRPHFQGADTTMEWYSIWNRYIFIHIFAIQYLPCQYFDMMEKSWLSYFWFIFNVLFAQFRIRMRYQCNLKHCNLIRENRFNSQKYHIWWKNINEGWRQ